MALLSDTCSFGLARAVQAIRIRSDTVLSMIKLELSLRNGYQNLERSRVDPVLIDVVNH